jgi:tetratricopeptide (TPR) repeat protein
VEYWPNRPGYLPADLNIAEQLYARAIERDPSFALAHAMLSRLQIQGFYWMLGDSSARLEKGKAEAEKALQLQPDLAEAHAAIGYFAYYGLRDYDRALAEFALALKYKPNDPSVAMAIGYVQRRKGQFESAFATLTHAVRLDPRSSYDLFETGWTLMLLRRYADARRYLDRSLALAPDFFAARLGSAFIALLADGNTEPAREMLRRLPAHIDHPQVLEFLELDPRLSLEVVASRRGEALTTRIVTIPMPLLAAWAYRSLGEVVRARENFEAARRTLEASVALQPDDPSFRAPLARAYAALGRKEDAIREARKAVELLPLSRDAFDGSYYLQELAVVYAETGETDAAVRELQHLLTIPSLESLPRLLVDGKWAGLRATPSFQALIAR